MTAHSAIPRRSTHRHRAAPRLSIVAAAVLAACATGALANPSGATLVNGNASLAQSGSTLTITNSPGTILNWQSFSIAGGETTRFVQQDASSAVLNRVVGQDPSAILGTLASNGRVFLINPNGVLFGQDARIDVAGLIASTLNLSDQDFLANRLNFTGSSTAGVRNEGGIATTGGGSVYLIGSSVDNTGEIRTDGGSVVLAAGKTVRLGDTASPHVLVELDADSERVTNLGTVSAAGGEVNIYAGVIDQRGFVQANSVGLDPAGRIRFFARHDIGLAAGSQTSASGPHGGEVLIDSASGTLLIEGAVSATGATGQGGRIELTGQQVGLVGATHVDASGAAGGGAILVGGDYRGANDQVHNARAVYFGGDARLDANAVDSGDGGRIILWSDEATRAYGKISARGGVAAGNGGFVETSAKGYLDVTQAADVTAANGVGGTWLLDPGNLTVQATAGTLDTATPNFIVVAGTSTVSNTVINTALDAGTNVVLDTGIGATGGDGNLSVIAPITKSSGAQATLTMIADNNIVVTVPITDTNGTGLNVSMTAARTTPTGTIQLFGGLNTGSGTFTASAPSVQFFNPGYRVGGAFTVNGNFSMASNTDLTLGGSFNPISGNVLLDPVLGSSITIKSDLAGTMRTLAIGGSLNLTDVATDGPGLITLTDLNLTGPSVQGIASTTIATPIVNLNNSRLQSEVFAMSAGTLQGSGGQLLVNNNFAHSGGTINFGLSANSLIQVQHTGSSLNLTQSLGAAEVWLNTPDGSLTNAAGANAIAASRVKLESCGFCSFGGVGTAANPVRLSNVNELLVAVGGATASDIFIDNAGTAPLQLGFSSTLQIPAFQSPGAIANNSSGGGVNIKTAGDFALPDYCPDGCFANVRTQGGAVDLLSTGGSIGLAVGSGVIDTTPFPTSVSLPGASVTLTAAGNINVFAISTAASNAVDGAGASAGNVTLSGTNVDVINIMARGADGAINGTVGPFTGGSGGNILINASGELVGSGDVVSANFPFFGGYVASGGNGGSDQLGDTGYAGGNAGTITLNAAGAGGASVIGRLEAQGGNGGNGALNGGNGGAGGTLAFNASSSGNLAAAEVWNGAAFEAPALIASGGLGGSGATTGGTGGNAGSINLASTAGNIEYAWTTDLTGGSGGAGAAAGGGGNGGNLTVSAGGALVIGSALPTVSAVSIDTSAGTGVTSGTVGTATLSGAGGITQLDPLLLPNAATMLSLNAAIGSIDLLLANQFANVEGGSGINWALLGTQSYTIGNVAVAGNADFTVDHDASVPNVITFAGALNAGGDVTVRFDEPRFLPTGSITSGTGAANFIAFLPNAEVAPISIDDVGITDFQRLFTPTFKMGDATTLTAFDFANNIAAQFLNVGTLSIHTSGTVSQSGTGGVQVQGGSGALQVSAASVSLGAAANAFTTLAGVSGSTFDVSQNGSIVLGTVDGVTGISAPTLIQLESLSGDVDVSATGTSSANVLYRTPGAGVAKLGGILAGTQVILDDFAWTGGTLSSGSTLTSASGIGGALSGAITIDGSFTNNGPLSVSAALSGTGSLLNNATMTLANASFGGVQLTNAPAGSIAATGTNSIGTLVNSGSIDIVGGTTTGSSLVNNSLFIASSGGANFASVGNSGSIEVTNGGSFTATTLAANSGSNLIGSGGSVFVLGDYQQLGGTITGTYNDLQLSSLGALSFNSGLTASGTLRLGAATTLSLSGSAASYSGGSVDLLANSVVVDSTTVSATSNLFVSAANLSVTGTSAPAKLLAANSLVISGGTVTVDGASFGASIDPTLLDVSLTGDLTLTGGLGTGAPAELLGDSVNVTANVITLANGGLGSGATIVASAGNLAMNYANCNGCTLFPAQPTTADTGMFGQTVTLNGTLFSPAPVAPAPLAPATVSGETSGIEQLIVGTDLAESGAIESEEVAAGGALDDDDDETDDATANEGSINEQKQNNGMPICS